MNEELENQAAIALQKMIESATVVKDFALEQAPDKPISQTPVLTA